MRTRSRRCEPESDRERESLWGALQCAEEEEEEEEEEERGSKGSGARCAYWMFQIIPLGCFKP